MDIKGILATDFLEEKNKSLKMIICIMKSFGHPSQLTITGSNLTIKALEQGVKYVQS